MHLRPPKHASLLTFYFIELVHVAVSLIFYLAHLIENNLDENSSIKIKRFCFFVINNDNADVHRIYYVRRGIYLKDPFYLVTSQKRHFCEFFLVKVIKIYLILFTLYLLYFCL